MKLCIGRGQAIRKAPATGERMHERENPENEGTPENERDGGPRARGPQEANTMKKLIATVALVASLASGSLITFPSTALAASGPYMSSSSGHYGCTNTSLPGCNSQGTIAAGTAVTW